MPAARGPAVSAAAVGSAARSGGRARIRRSAVAGRHVHRSGARRVQCSGRGPSPGRPADRTRSMVRFGLASQRRRSWCCLARTPLATPANGAERSRGPSGTRRTERSRFRPGTANALDNQIAELKYGPGRCASTNQGLVQPLTDEGARPRPSVRPRSPPRSVHRSNTCPPCAARISARR